MFSGIVLVIVFEFFTDLFGPSLEPTESFVAAVTGAAIALAGTILTLAAADEAQENKRRSDEEQILYTVFAKIDDIADDVIKANRHLLEGDPRAFLFLGDELRLRKPLSGVKRIIRFDPHERAIAMSIKEAELYNQIGQCEGISETLCFLEEEYNQSFAGFMKGLLEQEGVEVKGRAVSGEMRVKQTDVLHILDLEQHLRQLTFEAVPEVRKARANLIRILGEKYSTKIDHREMTDVPGGRFSEG